MNPYPKSLPKYIDKLVSQYTFSSLFCRTLFKNGAGVHTSKEYTIERSPPIYVMEDEYIMLTLKHSGFDYISFKYKEVLKSSESYKPFQPPVRHEFHLYFQRKEKYIEERIRFPIEKTCKNCQVCDYSVSYKDLSGDTGEHQWKEDYCGQTMLISHDVPKPIQNIYNELSGIYEH